MDTKNINTPSNWKPRILSGIGIFLTVVAFFALRQITTQTVFLFDILIGALMIMGVYEIEGLFRKLDKPTHVVALGLFPVISFVLLILCIFLKIEFFYYILMNIGVLLVIFAITLLIGLLAKKHTLQSMYAESEEQSYKKFALQKSSNTILACLYPTFLLTFVFLINHFTSITQTTAQTDVGLFGLVLLFATTMVADCCALFAGRFIPTKKISITKLGPGKTWSGLVGGILGAILASALVFVIFNSVGFAKTFSTHGFTIWWCLFAGLLSGVFNMAGDMTASFMKRQAGTKDFGNLIPGHGGVMDRINGLIFNAVVVFIVLLIAF